MRFKVQYNSIETYANLVCHNVTDDNNDNNMAVCEINNLDNLVLVKI